MRLLKAVFTVFLFGFTIIHMLDHHLQRSIVYRLAFMPEARFSELKPDDVENKLFTYHLKKVMVAGYIDKNDNGAYSLTAEGKRLGYQAVKNERFLLDKAYSVLFMVVRRPRDGALLFAERKVQPLIGYIGFPIATPSADVHADISAKHDLYVKTGLHGDFYALGSGFLHVFKGEELESYTNFTLMVCENATGELAQQDPNAEYAWRDLADLANEATLPSVRSLVERSQAGKPFFLEETLDLGQVH